MAVIPGNSKPVPDSGDSVESIHWMQDVTEDTPKQKMREQVGGKIEEARSGLVSDFIGGLFEGFTNIIKGVGDIPSWLPGSARDAAENIRDGQLELNDRQDLLDNLLNMGRTYCSDYQNYPSNTWVRMPFDTQFGVLREVEIIDGGLRTLKPGQWNVWSQVYLGNMLAPFNTRDVEWEVRVYIPGENEDDEWKLHTVTKGRYLSNRPGHDVIITSFITETEVAHVEVWAKTNMSGRTFGYGPAYNQLTVQQITSERAGNDGSGESNLPDDGDD